MADLWRIAFMGTPQIAASTLEKLIEGPDPVVGVVTQPDRPAGRGRKPSGSPVRELANNRGLPVVTPEKIRTAEFFDTLKAWQPDVIAVVAYGRILPAAVLDLPPHGCINVHYSLLPKYRGAAPAAWTIINGEPEGGVTTMRLSEEMDAGPIYLQRAIILEESETAESLQKKLTPMGADLLLETLRRLKDGSLASREQDASLASKAPMLKKEDGRIDWSQSAVEIERRVRGLYPWPATYTYINGKLLKIHRAKPIAVAPAGIPGTVLRSSDAGFWVATGDGALALEEVQLENKNRLSGVAFTRGARVKSGDRLQ